MIFSTNNLSDFIVVAFVDFRSLLLYKITIGTLLICEVVFEIRSVTPKYFMENCATEKKDRTLYGNIIN